MLFGGRVAEELEFGVEKVTTGAGNDIERATSIARRMVTSYGMSDAVGLMAVGDSEQEVFIGRELVQRRQVSEHTAELVDKEVRRILEDAHDHARDILNRERALLEAIADALLERETLDREDIDLLDAGEPLPPMQSSSEREEGNRAVVSSDGSGTPSGSSAGSPAGATDAGDPDPEETTTEGSSAPVVVDSREPAEGSER